MTIARAIAALDEQKPNTAPREQKLTWLTKVELEVLAYEGREPVGYGPETDPETALLLPECFCDAYLYWMGAQIDLWNREYAGYNNLITLYNREMARFRAAFVRQNRDCRGGFTL